MAFLNVRGHQKMTEVIKNDLGEAVRLLTKQLRQIAIDKSQFEAFSSSSFDSTVVADVTVEVESRLRFFL